MTVASAAWTCPGCAKSNPTKARFCAGCGVEHATSEASGRNRPQPRSPDRGAYLDTREHDAHCRIHKIALDPTGFCEFGQSWWVPQFRCPHCAGPLWDNGFCPTCTPRTRIFPGDYFESRWDSGAGREWGHYVRVHAGPTPAASAEEIAGYFAELRALIQRVGTADEPVRHVRELQVGEEPAWITEEA